MNELSIIQVTPERLEQLITRVVKTQLEALLGTLKVKDEDELLTPKEASKLLKIDISTVHRRTKRGVLKKYENGGSVYYKRSEVLESINKSYQND